VKTLNEKLEEKQDKKWLNEIQESRDICHEILKHGVSQFQMRNIIKLLALELEDIETMKAITGILTENVNEEPVIVNILKPGGKTDE
jgi:hypothetical protein